MGTLFWLNDRIGHTLLSQIRSRQMAEGDFRDGGYYDGLKKATGPKFPLHLASR